MWYDFVTLWYFFIVNVAMKYFREDNEKVMPLIYGLIIKIMVSMYTESIRVGEEGLEKNLKKLFLTLAQHLAVLGDDNQGWGILGALGIGSSSRLSIAYVKNIVRLSSII